MTLWLGTGEFRTGNSVTFTMAKVSRYDSSASFIPTITPPPPLPKSPPPVYTHTPLRSPTSPNFQLSQEAVEANTMAFKGNHLRSSSYSDVRPTISIPRDDLADGAHLQESPSSAVRVHPPAERHMMEPSSVPIEDHGSQLSVAYSMSASVSPSHRVLYNPEEVDRASPSLLDVPESYGPSRRLSRQLESLHRRNKSPSDDEQPQEPEIQPPYHLGGYRHVSTPIIEPRPEEETYQPLQYHHQALEESHIKSPEKRGSRLTMRSSLSDMSSNYDPYFRHEHLAPTDLRNSIHGRSIQRPHSSYSTSSDPRGRARSPQLSPNRNARATSAHSTTQSPDTRPLSYVDLLNVPYPQPPPISAESLDNTKLRNAVGSNASLLSTRQTLEMYRANVKKTNDPAVQYEFAVFMINAAQEVSLEMEDLSVSGFSEKSHPSTHGDLLKEARHILQRLSDRSYPFAQYYLADGYASGLFNKGKEDYDKAFPLFISASKHGHAEAGYRAALCYEFGWGCRMDGAKAVQFYRQAASKNHPGAMLRLGRACLLGDMGLGKRYREGVKWLKRAAESADYQYNSAPYELGVLHETGYGDDIFQDESYAAQLFTKSADLGHPEANYRLGDAYEHGKLSCPRDPALSVHFYTGAAQRGHPLAQMALCAWYMVGAEPVLERDENEAYEWAKKAAESGLAKAEYAIGYFTEMGIGCRRDPLEANVWYVRAADQGDERAKHRIAAIRAAATGANPVTAAMPAGKGGKLKASNIAGNIGPGKMTLTHPIFHLLHTKIELTAQHRWCRESERQKIWNILVGEDFVQIRFPGVYRSTK